MKSIDFIQNRKDHWIALEDSVKKIGYLGNKKMKAGNLVSFMREYRRTSADLSLARSLFPHDQIIKHLNTLIIKALSLISAEKQSDASRIVFFFAVRLPQLVLRLRFLFGISCGIFILSCLAGYFLVMLNDYAANAIVGDNYIYMTIDNIQKGKPFAVYESGYQYFMSSYIMANNIKVAFTAFALGVFYGVGPVLVLLFNGLMLGSITAVFAKHGLLTGFTTTVLVHGTLELFAIMVAGVAGLRLGQSIFRPGNLTRMDALYRFGNEAFQLCAAMVPVLVIAGILEGYVTRLQLPMPGRLAIIIGSCLFLFFYLVAPTLLYLKKAKRRVETAEPSVRVRY